MSTLPCSELFAVAALPVCRWNPPRRGCDGPIDPHWANTPKDFRNLETLADNNRDAHPCCRANVQPPPSALDASIFVASPLSMTLLYGQRSYCPLSLRLTS